MGLILSGPKTIIGPYKAQPNWLDNNEIAEIRAKLLELMIFSFGYVGSFAIIWHFIFINSLNSRLSRKCHLFECAWMFENNAEL